MFCSSTLQVIFFSDQPFYGVKLFNIRLSYKQCNCLLVKMASKTVTRSILCFKGHHLVPIPTHKMIQESSKEDIKRSEISPAER